MQMHGSVIVIDDDKDLAECISDYLRLKEFDVVGTGHNGLEAVQLYEEFRPNVILMDVSMPNYDGIYGVEHIKRFDPDAKIIMLTGNYDEATKQKIKPFNVTKVLEKPYPLKQLEQILKSVNNTKHPSIDTL